jgi:iron transport multicopper oxidase
MAQITTTGFLKSHNGCPFYDTNDSGVPPGASFQYNFSLADQIGTYWIHSHIKGQYPNGLRAPFIIRDPDPPYKYDVATVLSVSDWV